MVEKHEPETNDGKKSYWGDGSDINDNRRAVSAWVYCPTTFLPRAYATKGEQRNQVAEKCKHAPIEIVLSTGSSSLPGALGHLFLACSREDERGLLQHGQFGVVLSAL